MNGLKIKELWRNSLENSLMEIGDDIDYTIMDSSTFDTTDDEERILKALSSRCRININPKTEDIIL